MVVHGPYPEPRVAREAAAATDAGYVVDVVATRQRGEPKNETIDGVRVTRLPVRHVHGAGMFRVIGEYAAFAGLATGVVAVRTMLHRYDVVQVHNPPDFLILSALLPRVLGSRVIFDIHDRSPDMFAMRFPQHADAATTVLQRMERLATAVADVVITVHEPYLRQLAAFGTPPDKMTVIMNSLDERLIPPPSRRVASPFRVVYHGTVTPHYGVDILVDAVAEAVREGVDVRVEIIGGGDAVPDLEERVRGLGLSDRILVEGRFVPHRAVLERVNGASVGVIPNLPTSLNRFALSSKLFEYVVLGVPVISAALPTICEHFSNQEVRFFEPGSVRSLADALIEVARNPEGAQSRAARARQRYETYRWEANARKYVAILNRLTASPSSDVGISGKRADDSPGP